MKRYLLLLVLIPLSFSASAQFVVKAELRPKAEVRNGYSTLLSEDDRASYFISQRSRLSFEYLAGIFQLGLSIQDVRVWGDEKNYSTTGIFGDESSLELHEAWLGIQLYEEGSLKIGRQTLSYEDERILSKRNWNQGGLKYDAVLFRHAGKSFRLDAGFTYHSNKENNKDNPYPADKLKTIDFIYFSKPINEWLDFSLMALASGAYRDDSTEIMFIQGTYAAYLNVKKENLTGSASVFFQNGNSRYKTTSSAYMFAVKGDYKAGKFTIGAGLDYLSGQDASNADSSYNLKDHSFDNLYGVRHSVFGHMDLFNNVRKSTGQGGLVDPYIKFKWQFAKTAQFTADLHYFWLQTWVAYPASEEPGIYLDKALGPEFDLGLYWDINSWLNLRGGYSMMFPTRSMNVLQELDPGETRPGSWVWVMLTATPTLFSSEKK